VKGKILMVVASPAKATTTGWPVGFWASELTHPYDEFTHAGYEVVIASLDGGKVELDAYSDPRHESGYSAHDFVSLGFVTSPLTSALLNATMPLNEIDYRDFAAIVAVGGQAPMFTFRDNAPLQRLIRDFYQAGKSTAALCHGVAAFVDVTLSNGKYLVAGKKLTGFSNAEDEYVDNAMKTRLFPWRIEDALKQRGAEYSQAGMWADYAVADKNLVTGQQQNSGRSVARLVLTQLSSA
jgi:putative intracellular protease/amidase